LDIIIVGFFNAQVIGKTVPMSGNSKIQIKCILFDIGGVLTSDVEHLLINNISTGIY